MIDKAIAIEIAKGRPSGIATIKMHTAKITILNALRTVLFEAKERSVSNRIMIARKRSWVAMMRKVTSQAYLVIV